MQWRDDPIRRGERERSALGPPPRTLPLLDPEQAALLRRWVAGDELARRHATLMAMAGPGAIELAETLCDRLLAEGWISRRERLSGGHWQWEAIRWLDLPRLQALLGVAGPRRRGEERQALLAGAEEWLRSRGQTDGEPDPDLLDELERSLSQLRAARTLTSKSLAARLELLRAVADWREQGREGSRRDFALQAGGTTKSLSESDWRWLEAAFDLERLRISRFAPVMWLAGSLALAWGERRVDVAALLCAGLPLEDVARAGVAAPPVRWWLVENRASFERQARALDPGVALVWLPGRPSAAWLGALGRLLDEAPAPAWISGDADPAGVDIACAVGELWEARGLAWAPHRMAAAELQASPQVWPLNADDRRLLARLLARPGLPADLRELCLAMQESGRKAEQEGWL